MLAKAIRIAATGGPEVMQYVDVDVGAPGPGEALLRQHAIGLNFIDVYYRTGLYPQPLPGALGREGAGVVEAVGAGVTGLQPGDRVAYAGGPNGAYAGLRTLPADVLVKLPDAISFETAAAMMLQGLTVQYLLRSTYPVARGQTILFHAAAGGVGLIACQWARALGVELIGTVGSKEKGELALAHGAAHVIDYTREDIATRVREITGGAGVPVVYDSVGKDTFIASLDCMARRGMMVSFGNASGAAEPMAPGELARRGSLYLTRPVLGDYASTRAELDTMAADLFQMVTSGKVKIDVHQRFNLRDAADAHRALEGRRTTGSTILLP